MLCEALHNEQGVLAPVPELLPQGSAKEGRQEGAGGPVLLGGGHSPQ